MRAAGVPGRGENGKTCNCVKPQSSTRSSERVNMTSLSVGNPAMMSAPNTTSGRRRRTRIAERDGIGARMPPLHALEDQIVARLQRQMQMRHQPRLVGQRVEQIGVGFHGIDRRQPQARNVRHILHDALDQRAQPRLAVAVTGDIDAGEHHFAIAVSG